MKIMITNFLLFLPIYIIGFSIILNILCIAWKRNHLTNFILTCCSLFCALLSLLFNFIFNFKEVSTFLFFFDNYSFFLSILIIFCSLISCFFSYHWLNRFSDTPEEFYLLILIGTLGGIILTSINHMASFFIGLELISLPLFGLIGYAINQKYALESTIKYSILSCTASGFTLFGIAFLYTYCGNLKFHELSLFLNNNQSLNVLLLSGLTFILVGVGFKLSLAPFHFWTPDIYQGAPTSVVYFLSTVSKISVLSAIIRFFMFIPENKYQIIYNVFSIFSCASILVGSFMAITQKNIKRLIGYSSITHFGYLVITLVIQKKYPEFFLETIIIYLLSYLLSNIGIFGILGLISNKYHNTNEDNIFSYRGLFWKDPYLSFMFTIMLLSLAGIPLTLGFIGKFYIIAASLNAKLWFLTSILILGSMIGIYYYLRVIIILYLPSSKKLLKKNIIPNWISRCNQMIVLCSCILIFLFGVYPQQLINLIQLISIKI